MGLGIKEWEESLDLLEHLEPPSADSTLLGLRNGALFCLASPERCVFHYPLTLDGTVTQTRTLG